MTTNPHHGDPDYLMLASSVSDPNKIAGAIAHQIRRHGRANLQAIGAAAVNQAVKGIAVARGFIAPSGRDLITTPGLVDIDVDGAERTAVRFRVELR